MSAARMPRDAADPLDVKIALMHRRDVRHVMPIEQRVYPRGWSKGVFVREIAQRDDPLLSHGEGRQHARRLHGDAAWRPTRRTSRTSRSRPSGSGTSSPRGLLLTQAAGGVVARREPLTLEVRPSNLGAQELYRQFGFAPAGMRKLYYRDPDEDGLIMWAHDIDQPAYLARLRAIEAEIPGTTVVDDEVWK